MTEDQSHPIITAIKKKLKEIYPWEVLYINGKYRPEYQHFTFPIIIKTQMMKLLISCHYLLHR